MCLLHLAAAGLGCGIRDLHCRLLSGCGVWAPQFTGSGVAVSRLSCPKACEILPITSWQIEGEKVEAVTDFFFLGLQKSLQTLTAAIKFKDACSFEGKL